MQRSIAGRSAFARTGNTSPLGKIQPPLGQLRLHDLADEKVRQAAARAGKPVLEYLRDYIEAGHCYEELVHRQTIYLGDLLAMQPKRNESATER